MSHYYTFNQYTFIKRLVEAGIPEKQAETLGAQQDGLVETGLATKQDVNLLRQDIDTLRRDMDHGFALSRKDITIKLGSMLAVAVAVVAAIVKL